MKVEEIMVSNPVVLTPSDTVRDALEKFTAHKISGCPVVDENNSVVGMFSEVDLLASLKTQYRELKMLYPPDVPIGISFEETTRQRKVLSALQEVGNTRIERLMKTSVITISSDDPIEDALQLMVNNRINRLPVVQDNKLVGIITRGDIIKGIYMRTTSS